MSEGRSRRPHWGRSDRILHGPCRSPCGLLESGREIGGAFRQGARIKPHVFVWLFVCQIRTGATGGGGEKKPLARNARKFHARSPEVRVKFTSPAAG